MVKEGFQDYNALKLLEEYIGREQVLALLEENGVKGYTQYPRDGAWHVRFRQMINDLIKKHAKYVTRKTKEKTHVESNKRRKEG